jgi:hypothetical protein
MTKAELLEHIKKLQYRWKFHAIEHREKRENGSPSYDAYQHGITTGFLKALNSFSDWTRRLEMGEDAGWISVKDRLPDTTEHVFTCVKMDGIPQCVGFHYYKDGKWWEGYEEDSVGAVEYWMQIPKFKEAKK